MIYDAIKQHAKIIDFGLASHSTNGNFCNDKRVGKTGYMAPEVYAKKQYDGRKADIWSLGVMLFMMLIGAPPYELPTPSCPSFNYIINGHLRQVLQHWKRLRHVTQDALDLMTKIFKFENDRISMEDILKHPFVQLDTDPLYKTVESKIQTDSKESPDNKVEEVIEEHITNNNLDNNNIHTRSYHSSDTTTTTDSNTTSATSNSNIDTNTAGTATIATNTNIIAHADVNNNHQNVHSNSQRLQKNDSPAPISKVDDNKNDDKSIQTNFGAYEEIEDRSNIRSRKFKSSQANDFRKKILEIEDQLNADSWNSFIHQIQTIINDRNDKKKQISKEDNPGFNGEFPLEGVIDDADKEQIEMEIEELQWLHIYVTSKKIINI